jgi:protein translocase SEC61 complex gamma subunit
MNLNVINESIRVLKVASKPRKKDFEKTLKIVMIGILIIGIIGVIISEIFALLNKVIK